MFAIRKDYVRELVGTAAERAAFTATALEKGSQWTQVEDATDTVEKIFVWSGTKWYEY